MAGYPPQQQYAAPPHQSASHGTSYHTAPYPVHPHQSYGPPIPPGPPPFHGPFPSMGGGPSTGTQNATSFHSQGPIHPGPPGISHGVPEQRPFDQQMPANAHAPSQPRPPSLPPHSNFAANAPIPTPPGNSQHHHAIVQHHNQPIYPPSHPPSHEFIPQHHQAGHPHQTQGRNHVPHPSSTSKQPSAASKREKERPESNRAGPNAKSGQRRTQQGGQSSANARKNASAANNAAKAAAADEPLQETKKIRKRKEVVDRIHRVHWDTIENRDLLYNDMQHALAATAQVLLLSPALSRPYLLALQRLTLERDAELRQSALLHAHQVESARSAYEQERNKVDEEARNAKRAVRERLLAAVEERRKKLREDKEGGESINVADAFLDSSSRTHATRKLRNKAPAFGRFDGGADSDGGMSIAAKARISGNNGTPLRDGTSTPQETGHPQLGSLLDLSGFGMGGSIASLPPSNFDTLSSSAAAASLLHLGVGGGMGDSSYMSGFRATLQNHGKSKKKTTSSSKTATAAASTANAISNAASGGVTSVSGEHIGDDDDDETTSRSMAAAAAAAVAAATMLNGGGRLRWDQGKSVGQLTSAKDIEIESDLINIRKVGNKRRRR